MDTFKIRVMTGYKAKSVRSLAKDLGLHEQTLHGWLKQTRDIPTEWLQRFSADTGLSVDYLLNGVEDGGDDFITHAIVWIKETDAAESERTREMIRMFLDALPRKTAKP